MLIKFVVFFLLVALVECGSSSYHRASFNYTINNQLVLPNFHFSIKLPLRERQPLIRYMEAAVLAKPTEFTGFEATFTSPYGYFITSINKLAGNWSADRSYWQILNLAGPLTLGVSSYFPSPGDHVTFNFTQG